MSEHLRKTSITISQNHMVNSTKSPKSKRYSVCMSITSKMTQKEEKLVSGCSS